MKKGVWGEERAPTIPQPFHFATEGRSAGPAAAAAEAPGAAAHSQGALLRALLEEEGGARAAEAGRAPAAAPAAASPQNITAAMGGWGENAVDITRM